MKILIREHNTHVAKLHSIMLKEHYAVTVMLYKEDYYDIEYLNQFEIIIVSDFFPEISGYAFIELARAQGYMGKIILLYSFSPAYASSKITRFISMLSSKETLLTEIQS